MTALALGAFAWATPRINAVGPIQARGTAGQSFIVATTGTTTVTRSVRVKIRSRTYVRRVTVSVPSVRRLIGCGGGVSCDTAFQRATIQPGGSTGWHTHPE